MIVRLSIRTLFVLLIIFGLLAGCDTGSQCQNEGPEAGRRVVYIGATGVGDFFLNQTYFGQIISTGSAIVVKWDHLFRNKDMTAEQLAVESGCFSAEKNKRVEYFGTQGPGDPDFSDPNQAYFGRIVAHFGADRIEVDWEHLNYNTVEQRKDLEIRE